MVWTLDIECTGVMREWERLIAHYHKALGPHYEDGGVQLGEIIAWRAWRVHVRLPSGTLFGDAQLGEIGLLSTAAGLAWPPGETIVSKPTEAAHCGLIDMRTVRAELGTHGWKTRRDAERYMKCMHGGAQCSLHGLALGTVKLWGQVYEHEIGYRAEFAKVNSIVAVWWMLDPLHTLHHLQQIYG